MPETSLSYLGEEWRWYRDQIGGADSPTLAAGYYLPLFLAVVAWWLLTRPLALLAWPVRKLLQFLRTR